MNFCDIHHAILKDSCAHNLRICWTVFVQACVMVSTYTIVIQRKEAVIFSSELSLPVPSLHLFYNMFNILKNFLLFSSIDYVSCVDRLQSSISCIEFSVCQTDIWFVVILNEKFLYKDSCIIKMTPLNYCRNILQRMCMMHAKYFHCFQTFMLFSTHQSSSRSESETLTGNFKALFVMLSQLKYIWVFFFIIALCIM